MRATQHNGRQHKNGQVFSAKHNDRNFNTEAAKHIDKERSCGNIYWSWNGQSFDESERCFYAENFWGYVQQQNERYKQHGDYKKVKDIDAFRRSPKNCPEEQIIQLGKYDKDKKMVISVASEILQEITAEQMDWERERFPNCVILNYALHTDETVPHIHIRKVWIADYKGRITVSQNKALEQMGVKPPKENETVGRYNNAKMTYTAECREHLEEICRRYGIELETERLEPSRTGLEQSEYQRRQQQEEMKEMKKELEETRAEVIKLRKAIIETEEKYAQRIDGDSRKQINRLINERDRAEDIAREYRQRLEEASLDTSIQVNKTRHSRQQNKTVSRILGRD